VTDPASSQPDILIVRFSSMGDLLLTTPLLRAIRTRYPGCRITFVVREDHADTLRHNPRIDRLITWRRGSPLRPLVRQLRSETFTHRLDLHGSLRSRLLRWLVGGKWSGYPKRRLRRWLLIFSRRRLGGALGHVADRFFEAARELGIHPDGGPPEFFVSAESERAAIDFIAAHGVGRDRGLVAIAPGAAHATKRWPVEHWEALVLRLRSRADVLILGGPAEAALGEHLATVGGPTVVSAAGKFSLVGSAALLRRAKVLAVGDTGLLHLATAVGTPVVGLYGPGVAELGFFPYQAAATVLQRDLKCRPCSKHGSAKCPLGHHHCLREILPHEVAAAMDRPPR
jgi:lipopolysaccharide heptosyltransferase II